MTAAAAATDCECIVQEEDSTQWEQQWRGERWKGRSVSGMWLTNQQPSQHTVWLNNANCLFHGFSQYGHVQSKFGIQYNGCVCVLSFAIFIKHRVNGESSYHIYTMATVCIVFLKCVCLFVCLVLQVSVGDKLGGVVGVMLPRHLLHSTTICNKCFHLVNELDILEHRLSLYR